MPTQKNARTRGATSTAKKMRSGTRAATAAAELAAHADVTQEAAPELTDTALDAPPAPELANDGAEMPEIPEDEAPAFSPGPDAAKAKIMTDEELFSQDDDDDDEFLIPGLGDAVGKPIDFTKLHEPVVETVLKFEFCTAGDNKRRAVCIDTGYELWMSYKEGWDKFTYCHYDEQVYPKKIVKTATVKDTASIDEFKKFLKGINVRVGPVETKYLDAAMGFVQERTLAAGAGSQRPVTLRLLPKMFGCSDIALTGLYCNDFKGFGKLRATQVEIEGQEKWVSLVQARDTTDLQGTVKAMYMFSENKLKSKYDFRQALKASAKIPAEFFHATYVGPVDGYPALVNARAYEDLFNTPALCGGPPGGPYQYNYQRELLMSLEATALTDQQVGELVEFGERHGLTIKVATNESDTQGS